MDYKIKKIIKEIYNNFVKANTKGLSAVFMSSVVNKIVAFASNLIVIRVLSQKEYGLYSSSYNVIALALLINGAGMLHAALVYGAEKRSKEEKNQYYKYVFVFGLAFDILMTFLLVILVGFGFFIPIKGTRRFIILLSPIIVLQFICDYLTTILRSQKRLKEYALLLNINTILLCSFSCLGVCFANVTGMIVGRCLAYIVTTIIGMRFLNKLVVDVAKAPQLSYVQKSNIRKYSFSTCLISAMNRILYVIDITIIGYIVKDPIAVAIYKVGITMPEALEFIPDSVIVTIIPYMAEHNNDFPWLRKWTSRIYLYTGGINFVISFGLLIFAPIIIKLLWGETYIEAIPIFRILTLNYFVLGTFRKTGTNVLSVIHKNTYNVVISAITAVLNLFLDISITSKYGIVGAAYATLLSTIMASILSTPYLLKTIYKSNYGVKGRKTQWRE